MIRLSREQVLSLHKELVERFGGTAGNRDDGLLDSALSSPFQSFSGQDLYPDVIEKAAALCWGLVKNHPFIDGNKRTGAHVMLVSLALNGLHLRYEQKELIDLILALAAGALSRDELTEWLRSRIEK